MIGSRFKTAVDFYSGIISFSILSHVQHIRHVYILGNI